MYLLGFDIGSSAVKASLLEASSGRAVASATSPPDGSLPMDAERPGWAEQDPDLWWKHVCYASNSVMRASNVDAAEVIGIGIAYQMHGLVLVDESLRPLRPAIIWCDSRAVSIGDRAFHALGPERCLQTLLNSPGNFTGSKLRWVRENEPDILSRAAYAMLPGDYIALRMTGDPSTTPSGLSEGTLWNVKTEEPATFLLNHFDIPTNVLPPVVPTFAEHGALTADAAAALGLNEGTPVSYRAGDQPNNALSLGALRPGELAATAGTSGVVYGVIDSPAYDPQMRVNTFLHVNHTPDKPRYGVLLCVNGTGILYRWLRDQMGGALSYQEMNAAARLAPPGAEGLLILPYGNGAERTLNNRNIGASLHHLHFNTHTNRHVLRAAQEGIAFALRHGLEAMSTMGLKPRRIRAGHGNLFQSELFTRTFATLINVEVELYDTDGAAGAARGAGVGIGFYRSLDDAFEGLQPLHTVEPDQTLRRPLEDAFERWTTLLSHTIHLEHSTAPIQ